MVVIMLDFFPATAIREGFCEIAFFCRKPEESLFTGLVEGDILQQLLEFALESLLAARKYLWTTLSQISCRFSSEIQGPVTAPLVIISLAPAAPALGL